MTLAVRSRMLGASPETTSELVQGLFENAYLAASAAPPYVSGRA